MDDPDIYNPQSLGRRQRLAAARQQREVARLALLADLFQSQRRSDDLKRWISNYSGPVDENLHPELVRMVEWATGQLNDLDRVLDPKRISEALRQRELFPANDPLKDPKGEPPSYPIWGHSTAAKYRNTV